VFVKGTGGKYKYVILINNDGDHVDEFSLGICPLNRLVPLEDGGNSTFPKVR
jgi:hypothetical protein